MARIPTLNPSEAEAQIGARGATPITVANRNLAKKWLVAQGFPSAFIGTLTLRELNNAYNDVNDHGIQAIRDKLNDAGETFAGDDEAQEAMQTASDGMAAWEAAAAHADNEAKAKAAQAAHDANTKAIADKAKEVSQAAGDTSDAAQRALKALQDLIAGANQTAPLDENRVRVIAREEIALADNGMRTTRFEVHAGGEHKGTSEGYHHPMFEKLARMVKARDCYGRYVNIFISGEASSGKTYATMQLSRLMGAPYNMNGAIGMAHEMLGFIDGNGTYHDTPFRRAYEFGGVYTFDEVDRSDPGALLTVNPALAGDICEFPDKQVKRHADCIIIATGNTWGTGADATYSGATKLDAAFLSRFPVRLTWNIDLKFERQIVANDAWCDMVQAARAKANAAGLKVMIDTRVAIAGSALINGGMTTKEAADFTFLANLKPEQRKMILA